MVFPWGPSVYHHRFRYGRGHDTRSGFSLLRARKKKVRSDHDLGLHGLLLRHHVPMVLLGLFARILGTGNEWLHWKLEALRPHQYPRCSKSRLAIDSRVAL